jgi:chromosome segregation ATPase
MAAKKEVDQAEERIGQAAKRLDELEQQLERVRKEAEDAQKDLRKRGSPPEDLQVPEDLHERSHYPGLG